MKKHSEGNKKSFEFTVEQCLAYIFNGLDGKWVEIEVLESSWSDKFLDSRIKLTTRAE